MMTVKEVSNLTEVSIRTLQYYDKIGLLHPAHRTQAGYRLYDDAALERLQQILLFRELEFSLEDIRKILKNPEFDREKALEQQITLLNLKKQHLEKLIALAEKIRTTGGNVMDFNAFDTQKIREYAERAKKEWGKTTEYQEFEAKNARRTQKESGSINEQLMGLVAAFGTLQTREPADPAVQALPGEKVRQNSHRKPLKFIADKPKVGVNIRLLQLAWSVDDETLRNKRAPASG